MDVSHQMAGNQETLISLYDEQGLFLGKVIGKVTIASARLSHDLFSQHGLAAKRQRQMMIIRLTGLVPESVSFAKLRLVTQEPVFRIQQEIPVAGGVTFYGFLYGGKWPKDVSIRI